MVDDSEFSLFGGSKADLLSAAKTSPKIDGNGDLTVNTATIYGDIYVTGTFDNQGKWKTSRG